ncbi:14 kDa phosphohistidine phosphatase-like [Tubulanus polymorphus]|uniref:14 kDa phosphohistidine phosphatase-like n=1 Tax=Tubulanus polymorphus TaxID=672921 RepID=UPI003DA53BBD
MSKKTSPETASSGAASHPLLSKLNAVDIDTGKMKYVLIKVVDEKSSEYKYLVRGYCWAEYHADIYEKVEPEITSRELDTECVGGGRIEHEPASKKIKVYGYSMGYGKADHSITTAVLKQKFRDYKDISFTNSGY